MMRSSGTRILRILTDQDGFIRIIRCDPPNPCTIPKASPISWYLVAFNWLLFAQSSCNVAGIMYESCRQSCSQVTPFRQYESYKKNDRAKNSQQKSKKKPGAREAADIFYRAVPKRRAEKETADKRADDTNHDRNDCSTWISA